uniref:Uncharacterized protein LOC104230065 n=1 Tax=Nicotiana sylvestris TaxID=4096 RepID=A0A1U7WMB6_NICSY|nr:PREDICTED: uncharacterized protein LOC104230065 [Nicotiana sylvestris]
MHANEIEGVELDAYRLKGVTYLWFEPWEDSREEGKPPVKWSEFANAFIDHFLPAETRSTHAIEFENLKQGSKDVWGYYMDFACLSKYVIHISPTMEARAIENHKLKNRMEQKGTNKARSTGNIVESFGGARLAFRRGSSGSSQSVAQSSASVPPSGPSQQQQWSCFRPSQGSRGPHQQGRSGGRSQQQQRPPCPRCVKMHSVICYMELLICYGCGMRGHIQRHCRVSRQGADRGTT